MRFVRQKLVRAALWPPLPCRSNNLLIDPDLSEGAARSAAPSNWGDAGEENYTERSALVPFKLTRVLGVAQAPLQERQAGAISVSSGYVSANCSEQMSIKSCVWVL